MSAAALLDPRVRVLVTVRGCDICFGTGRYFAKPGELKDCPNGCRKPSAALVKQVSPLAAFGCPGCPCTPVACESGACQCPCCCIHNYPLPAVAHVFGSLTHRSIR